MTVRRRMPWHARLDNHPDEAWDSSVHTRTSGRLRGRRGALTAIVTTLLLAAVPALSVAAPSPDQGPTAGGTPVSDALPPRVTLTSIYAASNSTFGFGSDGRLYSWGSGTSGELGNGEFGSQSVPTPVQQPEGVTFVETSLTSPAAMALGSDGVWYAWGSNSVAQLGNGTMESSAVPTPVTVLAGMDVAQAATSGTSTMVLDTDGQAWVWGGGSSGQLGNGTTGSSTTPVAVTMPAGVTFSEIVAGSGGRMFGFGSDGVVYAWGHGFGGGLGTGSTANTLVPTPVLTPDGVTYTELYPAGNRTIARGSDGNLYAWGQGTAGELGDGTGQSSLTPVQVLVPPGVEFTQLSVSSAHAVAIGSDGQVYAWGNGSSGGLGTGNSANQFAPTPTFDLGDLSVTQVTAGAYFSAVIASDGNAYAVGQGSAGKLGNGTTQTSATPVQVLVGSPVVDEVAFGTTPGTGLSQDDTRWTAVTPAHACGPVDVTVTHSQMGLSTTTVVPDGFTFGTAPTVTGDPAPATIARGGSVTLTAAADGDDSPTVSWQQRPDASVDWQDVPGATATTLAAAPGSTTDYRAVFANCLGSAATASATVTVTAAPAQPTPPAPGPGGQGTGGQGAPGTQGPDAGGQDAGDALAHSGAATAALALLALALLAVGGVLRARTRATRG